MKRPLVSICLGFSQFYCYKFHVPGNALALSKPELVTLHITYFDDTPVQTSAPGPAGPRVSLLLESVLEYLDGYKCQEVV